MDKIVDLTRVLEQTKTEAAESHKNSVAKPSNVQKSTNPILKKLAQFKNEDLSKKFDINDLL